MISALPRKFVALFIALISFLLIGIVSVVPAPRDSAVAADASLFNPGNIISDQNFFNGYALDANEVQAFLNARVPVCDEGYTCLKDYVADTPYREAADGRCAAFPGGRYSGAQIIALVGQVCGISQKALLVLLEKESSLVTDTWPMDWQYRAATGQGCPDTAECDSTYRGFFNQVYWAARQFKNYALWPEYYNHHAGEVYPVRYSPNADCGSSDVYLENQATAGLYNYTPYQPNQAALDNLYGTGDECSAYGNRNFWRIYSDWFGNPQLSSFLVHAPGDAKVYLVTQSKKYPVANIKMLQAFGRMGPVTEVSASYLNSLTLGKTLSRVVQGPAGNKWFIDRGQRYAMTCPVIQSFGKSCDGTDIPMLETNQIFTFTKSTSSMTPRVTLSDGTDYIVRTGKKFEVFDNQSLTDPAEAALTPLELGPNALTEFTLGTPAIRSGVLVKNLTSSNVGVYIGSSVYIASPNQVTQSVLGSTFTLGDLLGESFRQLPKGAPLTTNFWTTGDSKIWALTTQGVTQIPNSAVPPTMVTSVPAGLVSSLPQTRTGLLGFAAKTVNGTKTFLVINGNKRAFSTADQLTRALGVGQIGNAVVIMPDASLAALPTGTNVPDTHKIFTAPVG